MATAGLIPAIPSSKAIRDELLDLVVNDLLGPSGGPEEEVDERSVQDRYLVGMLAPKKRKADSPETDNAEEEEEFPPVEYDELAVAGQDSAEEGKTEPAAPKEKDMFPSSFGLTFCVAGRADAIRITARWGYYEKAESQTILKKDGDPKRVWKRTPREGVSGPLALKAGRMGPWVPCPEQLDVVVRGIIRKKEGQWIVTLFLVNGQTEPKKDKDSAWLFQPELIVEGSNDAPVFLKRPTLRDYDRQDCGLEEQTMDMLYRRSLEFAVGHGVGVHWELAKGETNRAWQIRTRVIPAYEVPKVTPPSSKDIPELANLVLDMKELSETDSGDFRNKLETLPQRYAEWIKAQEKKISDAGEGLDQYKNAARELLAKCEAARKRIEKGIDLLAGNEQVADAFRFMNRAMHLQRVHTLYSEEVRRGGKPDLTQIDKASNRTWYPFQLGFILLNLAAIADPHHPDRVGKQESVADLLWFPTGGGKTEAYLGLTAFTLAIRRLQKDFGGRDGENGVAVLMRYTLRLLTLQQFQRATALICACETIRRETVDEGVMKWGETPFRIGLWVGQRTTPNWTEDSAEAVKKDHGLGWKSTMAAGSGSPHQLTNCPWCGAKVDPGKNIRVEKAPNGVGRTLIYCGDILGKCPFSERVSPEEGLPILVVDEEVYRRLPSLLIATVDKFAQMPWQGPVQMLFGQVNGYCERHGFRSPEIEDASSHPAAGSNPRASTRSCKLLRPPDLIIQDELHLISGPLGSLVGLYETAVDRLCSWQLDEKTVRPKVIASTATIRRAQDQVHQIFIRRVNVFPPNGLDVEDNFFALQRPCCEDTPGRLYIGVCAPGRRLKAILIRVYVALMASAQLLYEKKSYGRAADPYMTLVGYFNSLRELGGMRRLALDDVRSRLRDADDLGLAQRPISESTLEELTSRKSSTDIPDVLDRLESQFDPQTESLRRSLKREEERKKLPPLPIDILLATNMVSVGVDVKRLGLMVVGGQPKTTAEYIQATSRVGRTFPGFVCTVFNWARPRDLSHYEQFEHYHATFYKHVEALSVTPFSCGAIDRALTALLVSCVRQMGLDFNENDKAGRIDSAHPYVKEALDYIVERAGLATSKNEVADLVKQTLKERLDEWLACAQAPASGRILGYREKKDGKTIGLLEKAGAKKWGPFTCLNSLRDVEPSVSLILDDRGLDGSGRQI